MYSARREKHNTSAVQESVMSDRESKSLRGRPRKQMRKMEKDDAHESVVFSVSMYTVLHYLPDLDSDVFLNQQQSLQAATAAFTCTAAQISASSFATQANTHTHTHNTLRRRQLKNLPGC